MLRVILRVNIFRSSGLSLGSRGVISRILKTDVVYSSNNVLGSAPIISKGGLFSESSREFVGELPAQQVESNLEDALQALDINNACIADFTLLISAMQKHDAMPMLISQLPKFCSVIVTRKQDRIVQSDVKVIANVFDELVWRQDRPPPETLEGLMQALTHLILNCSRPVHIKVYSRVLHALGFFNDNFPGVRELLRSIDQSIPHVPKLTDGDQGLVIHRIGLGMSGFQKMSSDVAIVRNLALKLILQVNTSEETSVVRSRDFINLLVGIRGFSPESPEICELIGRIADVARCSQINFTRKDFSFVLSRLGTFPSSVPEVRRLVAALVEKMQVAQGPGWNGRELGRAMSGLCKMNSHHAEVSDLMKQVIKYTTPPLNPDKNGYASFVLDSWDDAALIITNIFRGLRIMSTLSPVIEEFIPIITSLVKDFIQPACTKPLPVSRWCELVSGLQCLHAVSPGVPELLRLLLPLIRNIAPNPDFCPAYIANAVVGMRHLTANLPESTELFAILAGHVEGMNRQSKRLSAFLNFSVGPDIFHKICVGLKNADIRIPEVRRLWRAIFVMFHNSTPSNLVVGRLYPSVIIQVFQSYWDTEDDEIRSWIRFLMELLDVNELGFIDAQAVSNSLYAFRFWDGRAPEVSSIMKFVVSRILRQCTEPMKPAEIACALHGTRYLSCLQPSGHLLVEELAKYLKRYPTTSPMSPHHLALTLNGLHRKWNVFPEVNAILLELTKLVNSNRNAVAVMSGMEIATMLFGFSTMSTDGSTLLRLHNIVNSRDTNFRDSEYIYRRGLQGVDSESGYDIFDEGLPVDQSEGSIDKIENPDLIRQAVDPLLTLVNVLSQCMQQSSQSSFESGRAVSNAFYSLRGMTSDHAEVQALLSSLVSILQRTKSCTFKDVEWANAVYGLRQMNPHDSPVVIELIAELTRVLTESDPSSINLHGIPYCMALQGFRYCMGNLTAPIALLDAVNQRSGKIVKTTAVNAETTTSTNSILSKRSLIDQPNRAPNAKAVISAVYGIRLLAPNEPAVKDALWLLADLVKQENIVFSNKQFISLTTLLSSHADNPAAKELLFNVASVYRQHAL